MTHMLVQGDARRIPLADRSVHMIATSPPFFGLRNYGHPGQIGLEPTPGDFVAAMVAVGREMWRVLRDDGTLWLNLGDSLCTIPHGPRGANSVDPKSPIRERTTGGQSNRQPLPGLKHKDLCLVPERVALAFQEAGWYVRAKPPWVKVSPMPESVTDRPNTAHETVFLLSKKPRYFFDMDAVRVPSAAATIERDRHSRITSGKDGPYSVQHDHETPSHADGRHLRTNDFFTASLDELIAHHEAYLTHLRSVRDKGGLLASEDGDPLAFWVGAQSFKGAHFATWPARLVRPMILASTSEKGCCPACGAPWGRDTEREAMVLKRSGRSEAMGEHGRTCTSGTMVSPPRSRTLGWSQSCPCPPAAPVPCVVLDPFSGAGTTALTAVSLGRVGLGIDLSREYTDIAARRIERPHAPVERPRRDAETPLFREVSADA